MTDELTLRDKVLAVIEAEDDGLVFNQFRLVSDIATILEDTGSPAHMRVAAELRGE